MRTARSGGVEDRSVIALLKCLELGRQGRAASCARQLEVAEPREAVELGRHRVLGKGLGEGSLHLVAVVGAAHGDEVDHHRAREVAQAKLLGNRKTMMMGNHGVLIAAGSVAEAFDELYYLERACQTLVLAYSTGKPLNVMSDMVAQRTAEDWDHYADSAVTHFEEMKKVLDRKDPSYAE